MQGFCKFYLLLVDSLRNVNWTNYIGMRNGLMLFKCLRCEGKLRLGGLTILPAAVRWPQQIAFQINWQRTYTFLPMPVFAEPKELRWASFLCATKPNWARCVSGSLWCVKNRIYNDGQASWFVFRILLGNFYLLIFKCIVKNVSYFCIYILADNWNVQHQFPHA